MALGKACARKKGSSGQRREKVLGPALRSRLWPDSDTQELLTFVSANSIWQKQICPSLRRCYKAQGKDAHEKCHYYFIPARHGKYFTTSLLLAYKQLLCGLQITQNNFFKDFHWVLAWISWKMLVSFLPVV